MLCGKNGSFMAEYWAQSFRNHSPFRGCNIQYFGFSNHIYHFLFLVIPRSPKTCKTKHQNIAFSNLFQDILLSLSLLSPVIFIPTTALAVILKFQYLCCYGVLIKSSIEKAGEVEYYDWEKICVFAWKFQTSIYEAIYCRTFWIFQEILVISFSLKWYVIFVRILATKKSQKTTG